MHHYIDFSHVSYTYPNGHKALDDISFRITHGEKVALLGLNGAGKSTLLLHTNGLLLPQSGKVDIGGVTVCKKSLNLVRQSVGLVFQNPDDQLFMPTIEEDVAFGPINMGMSPEDVQAHVKEALEAVGLYELRGRAPFELSGGQRRAAAIATVLSMGPSILAMDEPTASLDAHARRLLLELLKTFDHTILMVTHDLEAALELCPRAILMADGKILADGPTTDLLADSDLMARASLDIPEILLAECRRC